MNKEQRLKAMIEEIKEQHADSQNFIVPSPFCKAPASYMLIEEDLLHVKEAFEKLAQIIATDESLPLIETALYRSAIASYGKCFMQNSAGNSVLGIDCFSGNPALKQIHEELMLLRHGFVAHRDNTEHETALLFIKLPKDANWNGRQEWWIKTLTTRRPSILEIHGFLSVVNHLLPIIEQRKIRQTQRSKNALFASFSSTEDFLALRIV